MKSEAEAENRKQKNRSFRQIFGVKTGRQQLLSESVYFLS